jgi:hypothetical protein
VINRGNARAEVFHKPEDYAAFFKLMQDAEERLPMRCLAWCVLPSRPQSDAELAALRKCIQRATPYGNETWQYATAQRLGLEASLRPRGRPRKAAEK